ncbi:hypothetical protein AB0E67_14635 [Streptomyces sp. NPDC032161]|uniref:hypothetical protein n=1 Tax=unclassified Streptomyces TaxID=2593676 RepID=UPI0033E3C9C8
MFPLPTSYAVTAVSSVAAPHFRATPFAVSPDVDRVPGAVGGVLSGVVTVTSM